MAADPDTLTADATVGDALALMDRGGYRHVPIVDGKGRIAGLLRQQDVLEYLAEAFPEEILNLPPRPHQRMEEPDGACPPRQRPGRVNPRSSSPTASPSGSPATPATACS